MSEVFESAMSLQHRLENLRAEHQVLDSTISSLCLLKQDDELTLRRLKKRILIVEDRITLIERMMEPESRA